MWFGLGGGELQTSLATGNCPTYRSDIGGGRGGGEHRPPVHLCNREIIGRETIVVSKEAEFFTD